MKVETIYQFSEEQIKDLHQLYLSMPWRTNTTISKVKKMVQSNNLTIGLCELETKKLLAFARVLTDCVFDAAILDVIVEESYRGEGLGRVLMEAIFNHPSLQEVESFSIVCVREIMPFYEKFGFTQMEIEFMVRDRQNN